MHLGIFSFITEYSARPDELARACEERGFESLWVGEHTHIPASRKTPYPAGEPLPKPYYHMADPFVSLMAAAAATTTLKVGTSVCLVAQHDPIVLAKTIATLDQWSNGRFLFGIGGGWNVEEMEDHGMPFSRRWKIVRERVEAMKQIWTREEASYAGEFVNFQRIISNPKPVQQPHPPILFGGSTARARQRVVNYCDGWIPIDVLLQDLPAAMTDLHSRAKEAGRDPDEIPVSVFAFNEPSGDTLKRYRDIGVDRVVIVVPRQLVAAVAILDQCAEYVAAVK